MKSSLTRTDIQNAGGAHLAQLATGRAENFALEIFEGACKLSHQVSAGALDDIADHRALMIEILTGSLL
eukprot:3528961-Karenia_brevis.AAC.1